MLSYYKILGVDQRASSEEIKKAYKALALKYHPDKNGGNKEFEELFKLVNAAYQVLIDTDKRRRHDLDIAYTTRTHEVYTTQHQPTARKEKTVYNRYGKFDWRKAPKYKTAPVYKVDKNYYRNVIISLGAMALMAVLSLVYTNVNEQLKAKEKAEREAQIEFQIKRAEQLFENKEYRSALLLTEELIKNNPVEYRFAAKKDDFIEQLNNVATTEYNQQSYATAINDFKVLTDFQNPVRIANWKMMAECYLKLGNLENAAHIYEYVLERDDENLQLVLQLAELYNKIGNSEKELDYYNEARYLFKKFQESSYGAAFEFIIDPKEMPETYYNMFKARAHLQFDNDNMEEVVKDCNWGIFLRPERSELYYLRAQARKKLNQNNRACNDIKRAIERGFSKNSIKIDIDCDYL
ncbi:tetratricopeptide repeat protein [Fulvivirga lutea]|uniref:DnaJ domain-containing protein n=1 Tax=Fulvivirga lutea TaxID=2810512 RepID=A0A975A0V3_9BACT|nr:DnaJ domain-containing protein [Fulvivirga lutea]QSE96867.1 DnaJ domain-containing protein [Fulvivirga lutea]